MKKIIVSTIMALSIAGSSIAFAALNKPSNLPKASTNSTKTTPTPTNYSNPQPPPSPNCPDEVCT